MYVKLKEVKPLMLLKNLAALLIIATTIPGLVCFSTTNTGYRNGRPRNRQSRSADCTGSSPKDSFPDLDYALLGYNIIKGYPQSFGHDPGFTYPIFKADYSRGQQSADCRYNVPYGYLIIPDISCSTSFLSSIIETTYELSKSLSISVNAGIELPVFSFKASAGYKKSSSSVSSGDFLYILSKATCRYYFAQLDTDNPPDFSKGFLKWAKKLSQSSDKKLYMDFFDRFGTHFAQELVFGAEYINQHKMESQKFKQEEQKGVDLKVSASYSSRVRVSGGFSLDVSERKAASDFNKQVSTETLTNGAAPPANGDALTWASTVKDNPVPIQYKLAPIADLFTEKYMLSQNINFTSVSSNLQNYSKEYCYFLQRDGYVDTCNDDDGRIQLMSTRLYADNNYVSQQVELLPECIAHCQHTVGCLAITYSKNEKLSNKKFTCFHFNKNAKVRATNERHYETIIFKQPKDHLTLTLETTNIVGQMQGDTNRTTSKDDCQNFCMSRLSCAGFSICECQGGKMCNECDSLKNPCKLFGKGKINHFIKDPKTTSVLILERVER